MTKKTTTQQVVLTEIQQEIQDKILHILTIYPVISPTMLQAAIGASIKPLVWRPALTNLITNGQIKAASIEATTPTGRYNRYQTIQLVSA